MYYTLQLYDEYGIPYYGGGMNAKQARQALLLEHNGNRIAFIGCNAKGEKYATASDTQPGAVLCDFDWMDAEISRLRSQGYLVIVTFQHAEYYFYEPTAYLRVDFRGVAEAGAVIVSGSQAHHTQGMEFFDGALLMYGLGNLFFDQFDISVETGQALIARHVFYGGRHVSTELISIIFVDYARPRLMTEEERILFLINVFEGSDW
jgi:poly-gamma-glutamate synthesis protein (capsule biosynthesis protein)